MGGFKSLKKMRVASLVVRRWGSFPVCASGSLDACRVTFVCGGSRHVSSVAEPAVSALEAIHVSTGLPWWATLVTTGAAVRLGLYPLTRRAREATSMVVSAFRRAQDEVRRVEPDRDDEADVDGSSRMEVIRRAREIMRAHPQRTSPLWMVVAPVAQVSVLIYGLYSVRYMAKTGWGGFEAGGPFWAVDLTLPAVDVVTGTVPLGMQGIIMPAAVVGGFMLSTSRLRPVMDKGEGSRLDLPEREQVQRWLMGHVSSLLELLSIPLMFGVLTSPQAPLYYWAASMFTSLGIGAAVDSRQDGEMMLGGELSIEAQSLLHRAAGRVAEGEYAQALGFLKQARILAPYNASVHMAFGDVLSAMPGKSAAAASHYRMVIESARAREGDRARGLESEVLAQRAGFALGMLLSGDDATKQEALELFELAASRVDDGDAFKPIAVRSLLSIAALTDDTGRRRDALALATSIDADVARRLNQRKNNRHGNIQKERAKSPDR